MNGANSNSKDKFIFQAIVFFSLAIIAFYLITEHRAHLLAYSSYIIFGVFILMHLFMHSGHGGHGEHGGHGGCGGGHGEHGQGEHKHNEEEKETPNAGEQQDSGKHEHSQEKLT